MKLEIMFGRYPYTTDWREFRVEKHKYIKGFYISFIVMAISLEFNPKMYKV